ncbi:phosphoribosyltransferase [Actinotalea sp. C106]|uniref:phosphoribosyltransferase n=1 Tax=Actinotalea sp. C106 TaxID=2908644 RepID=UPI002027B200|nr:phosphoribosyltransferase [Actinotalea sp. C106]
MEFRSIHQLNADLARWSETLPRDIDLVVGIPRSGMLAATMLALHLHTPLADVDGLVAGRVLGGGARLGRDTDPSQIVVDARKILVVDDSTNRGGAIRAAKARVAPARHLDGRLLWGAPYAAAGAAEGLLDHWYEKVSRPRVFEWNVLHHSGLVDACMDLDGVLLGVPTSSPLPHHPRLVPGAQVGWLVTRRPEGERPEVERWLTEHGVRFRHLVMASDGPSGQTGRPEGLPRPDAQGKAALYTRTDAWLFVEEDLDQARTIADAARRPVYCAGVRAMIYPGTPLGGSPRPLDTARWRWHEGVRMQRKRASSWRRRAQGVWRSRTLPSR